MTVIAMSHEVGTQGRVIATLVAQRLGLTFVDDESLKRRITDRLACHNRMLMTGKEGPKQFFNRLTRVDDRLLARRAKDEVLELAAYGNVLIRGWGAPAVLQDKPYIARIRVSATSEFRLSILAARHPTWSRLSLQRLVERSDSSLAGNLEPVHGPGWRSDATYHISIKTHELSVIDAAQRIEQFVAAWNPSCRDGGHGLGEPQLHRRRAGQGRCSLPLGTEHIIDYPSISNAESILFDQR